MMRGGGSLTAKYIRKGISFGSGSRQSSTWFNKGDRNKLSPELIDVTPEELVRITERALVNIIFGVVRSVGTKVTLAYIGYKGAIYRPNYDPYKYLSEIESYKKQKALLDEAVEELEKKEEEMQTCK